MTPGTKTPKADRLRAFRERRADKAASESKRPTIADWRRAFKKAKAKR